MKRSKTDYWWSGDTYRRISRREILRVRLGKIQGQTVFALCSDELNSYKDTSLLEKSK